MPPPSSSTSESMRVFIDIPPRRHAPRRPALEGVGRSWTRSVARATASISERSDDAPDIGQHGVALFRRGIAAVVVRGHQQRAATRRPGDGDVVGDAIAAGAGLVADTPSGREPGTQAFVAGPV